MQRLDLEPTLTSGGLGQLDVLVDGELLASRQRGLLTGPDGLPDPELVLEALERRLIA